MAERSAVNRQVPGSIPGGGDEIFIFFLFFYFLMVGVHPILLKLDSLHGLMDKAHPS